MNNDLPIFGDGDTSVIRWVVPPGQSLAWGAQTPDTEIIDITNPPRWLVEIFYHNTTDKVVPIAIGRRHGKHLTFTPGMSIRFKGDLYPLLVGEENGFSMPEPDFSLEDIHTANEIYTNLEHG